MTSEALDWIQIITVLASAAGLLCGAVGLYFVWAQLRQMSITREVDICLSFAEMSGSDEFQPHLNRVLALKADPRTEEELNSALRVCVFFELVGSICNGNYMSTKLIEEFYGPLVQHCFDSLEGYIKAARLLPNQFDFMSNFEKLAKTLEVKRNLVLKNHPLKAA